MLVIKRNGSKQEFDPAKINNAIQSALHASNCDVNISNPSQYIIVNDGDEVETIQNKIEN